MNPLQPTLSRGPVRPPLASSRPPAGSQGVAPDDVSWAPELAPVETHGALDEIVPKPWMPLPESLRHLGEVRDDADRQALDTFKQAERKGIWGDSGDSVARGAMALLRHHLPEGASLVDAAESYARLMEIEKGAHSDPTPHARRAAIEIASRLRPQESMKDGAEAYGKLLRFESARDIDGSKHACEAYRRIDAAIIDCQSRTVAAGEYMRDPDSFEQRQAVERTAFEARQAEVKRVAEQVSREPRGEARIVPENDGWLVINGVRVPVKPTR